MYIYIYSTYTCKIPKGNSHLSWNGRGFSPHLPLPSRVRPGLPWDFRYQSRHLRDFGSVVDSMGKLKVKKRQNIWCRKMAMLDIKLVKHNVVYLLCFLLIPFLIAFCGVCFVFYWGGWMVRFWFSGGKWNKNASTWRLRYMLHLQWFTSLVVILGGSSQKKHMVFTTIKVGFRYHGKSLATRENRSPKDSQGSLQWKPPYNWLQTFWRITIQALPKKWG